MKQMIFYIYHNFYINLKFIMYLLSRIGVLISFLCSIINQNCNSIEIYSINILYITIFVFIASIVLLFLSKNRINNIGYYNFTGFNSITVHLSALIFFSKKSKKPNIFYIIRSLKGAIKNFSEIKPNIVIRIYSPLCDPAVMKKLGFKSIEANKFMFILRKFIYLMNLRLSRDINRAKIASNVDRLAYIWIIEAKSFR